MMLSIMTQSITTFSIMTLSIMKLSIMSKIMEQRAFEWNTEIFLLLRDIWWSKF